MNFKNLSFSSPAAIVVTNSSSETLGIGGSAIHWPASRTSEGSQNACQRGVLTILVEERLDDWVLGLLNHPFGRQTHVANVLTQSHWQDILIVDVVDGVEQVLAFKQFECLNGGLRQRHVRLEIWQYLP